MSSFFKSFGLIAVGLGVGLGIAWFNRPAAPSQRDSSAASVTPTPSEFASTNSSRATSSNDASHSESTPVDHATPTGAEVFISTETDTPEPTLAPEIRDRLIEEITVAYTSYEPEALPKIAPFLRHSDPEIRAYARDAIVQVGHADGAKLLRDTAKSVRDPREAVALLEAAEYLDIPPAAPVAGTFKKNSARPGKPTASLQALSSK